MDSIVFFVPKISPAIEDLLRSTAGRLPRQRLIVCSTTEDLVETLYTLSEEVTAAVLCAGGHKELSLLAGMGELLFNTRSILVLPDRGETTLAAVLPLRPRYFVGENDDMGEVVDVLEKIAAGKGSPADSLPPRTLQAAGRVDMSDEKVSVHSRTGWVGSAPVE